MVDDEEPARRAVARVLGEAGFAVWEAADGVAGHAGRFMRHGMGSSSRPSGGGFGVGGYQYSTQGDLANVRFSGSSTVNTFAWQIGTGITYQLSDRITFDTGYRFFAMAPGLTPLYLSVGNVIQPINSYTSAFSASELLLSIRIYEPFRNWR